jgi:hypothetical protein
MHKAQRSARSTHLSPFTAIINTAEWCAIALRTAVDACGDDMQVPQAL